LTDASTPPATHRSRALLEGTVAVTIWAASFIATKIALREASPFTVVWLRFGMGTLLLGGVLLARHELRRPGWQDIRYFTLVGLVGITVHQWLQATGLVTALASTTAWLVSTSPILIAIIGRVFLGERLRRVQMAGIALAFIGVVLVVARGDWRGMLQGSFGSVGDGLVALSAGTWAIFTVLSRSGLRRFSPLYMMFYVMLAGWLLATATWSFSEEFIVAPSLSIEAWAGILFLGVLCSALAYLLWYSALTHLPASQAGALLFLEPLITLGLAAVFLDEQVVVLSILGGLIILAGVWMVMRP
jgi:drug/metabolite transporter (DMT)-like permease